MFGLENKCLSNQALDDRDSTFSEMRIFKYFNDTSIIVET